MTPVRIIAFNSEKEYKPYRFNEFADAYYQASRDRDYIVMKSIAQENYPVAIHEYAHLIIRHSGLPLPAWLNEGLAEVHSTLKPYGKQVQYGSILPGRFRELQTSKWLDLETLLAVDHSSPFYNEKEKAGVFYAQSWALTHMLYLSDDYWKKFNEFLALVKPDTSQGATFQKVYGKSPGEVTKDLERYLRGTRFNAALANVKLEKADESPDVRAVTKLESGLALADLLAVTRKRDEAKAAYESLARENPKDSEIEIAWARLAWMNRDEEEMKLHFARAIELGTTNGKVYFDYAMMLRESGAKEPEISALLRRAVELKPDLVEAHYMLGFYASNAGRFGDAVAHLHQVKKLEKGQAYPYFRTLAYAYYRLGRPEEAKKNAESALKVATEPEDVDLAKELLAYVTQSPSKLEGALPPSSNEDPPRLKRRETAPAEQPAQSQPLMRVRAQPFPIEGTLRQADCLGKSLRLRIEAGGKQMAFLIQDRMAVVVKSSSESGSYEFTCGPQKPVKVMIEYLLNADPKLGVTGLVRSIEFR
jgi:Flp pilus assembly protein TadD